MSTFSKVRVTLWYGENYLDDCQEFLDLTCLDRLDLQLNLFGMVLRCCGLKPEVER